MLPENVIHSKDMVFSMCLARKICNYYIVGRFFHRFGVDDQIIHRFWLFFETVLSGHTLCRGDGDDDDSVISCSASTNTLNIILRDKSLMKFIKYVGHDAPSSRWDIALEYTVDLDDDEIDDDEAEASTSMAGKATTTAL